MPFCSRLNHRESFKTFPNILSFLSVSTRVLVANQQFNDSKGAKVEN